MYALVGFGNLPAQIVVAPATCSSTSTTFWVTDTNTVARSGSFSTHRDLTALQCLREPASRYGSVADFPVIYRLAALGTASADDARMDLVPRVPLDHPATYDDLIALPEHVVGEIIDDELYSSPRPAPRHSQAASWLGAVLLPALGRGRPSGGRWLILHEVELHFGRNVLVPDIAGWRRERMPRLPTAPYFEVAPDWVCEILSPSTARLDRSRKLRAYSREGVGHAWLIEPIARTLEVFVLDTGRWTLFAVHEDTDVVRLPPFDDLEINLTELWPDEDESEGTATRSPRQGREP